jgi:hypoxanthine phosphoribosyltransferase
MEARLKFLKPSYDEIREEALLLFESIRKTGWTPDVNVGVGRGGLFVLRCLQDFYAAGGVKIRYVVPTVERYNGIASTGSIRIRRLSRGDVERRKVLVVDDVSDQGDSLIKLVDLLKGNNAAEVRTATIHFKPWSKLRPDFFVRETDSWIIYPWELYESIRLVLEKGRDGHPQESFRELVEDARISKREYLTFCGLATHSMKLSPELTERVRAVCELYRRLPQ